MDGYDEKAGKVWDSGTDSFRYESFLRRLARSSRRSPIVEMIMEENPKKVRRLHFGCRATLISLENKTVATAAGTPMISREWDGHNPGPASAMG